MYNDDGGTLILPVTLSSSVVHHLRVDKDNADIWNHAHGYES